MNEENNVEVPSHEHLDLEGLFDQLDDMNMGSEDKPEEEEVKEVAGKTPTEEPQGEDEPVEAESSEEKEEAEASDESEEVDWEKKFKEFEENMNKRLKDTQSAFHKADQANKRIMEKISNGEEVTPEELAALSEGQGTPDEMQKLIEGVNAALPIAKEAFSSLSGKEMEEIDSDIDAFNSLAPLDPKLVEELVNTPESARASFVIKRGGELKEVFNIVKENGGSVTEAIANAAKISTRKQNKMREEIKAELEKEYKEKISQYVSSSKDKPSIRGTSPKRPVKDEVDYSAVTASDIF